MKNELTVREAAHSRQSIRKYTDEQVPDETIRELVEIAGLAPSSMNVQPWRVVAVKDAAMKQRLMEAANGQQQVGSAAVVFALYADLPDVIETAQETVHPGLAAQADARAASLRNSLEGMPQVQQDLFANGQANIFLGFLLLAAESFGYATSAMLGFDPAKVKALLDIPAHAVMPALVAMGRPAEAGFSHHRHAVDRILRIV